MKTYTISALALLAVALIAAGVYAMSGRTEVPAYHPPAPEPAGRGVVGMAGEDTDPFDVTITYTADGFTPRDITIAQGTRVRFLNASKEDTWPASGVHPTHTLYPEKEASDCLGSSFDACRGITPGEFYDFTFYYPGTWPFHDHEHAYNTGTITVTASSTAQ